MGGRQRTLGIAARATSTMIASSGMSDIIRIYNRTQRDGIAFNLAYIGSDFSELPAPFDPAHMRALFEYGYDRGRPGYNRAKAPPI